MFSKLPFQFYDSINLVKRGVVIQLTENFQTAWMSNSLGVDKELLKSNEAWWKTESR